MSRPVTDTPFMKVRDRVAPCSTVALLMAAWDDSKVELKYMPEADRNALIAMKDMYKRRIADGSIHDYLTARAACANQFRDAAKMVA